MKRTFDTKGVIAAQDIYRVQPIAITVSMPALTSVDHSHDCQKKTLTAAGKIDIYVVRLFFDMKCLDLLEYITSTLLYDGKSKHFSWKEFPVFF